MWAWPLITDFEKDEAILDKHQAKINYLEYYKKKEDRRLDTYTCIIVSFPDFPEKGKSGI